MKICHLHLADPYGNPKTLVCRLDEGSIIYILYGSHGSSGTPFALSNLQCTLPVEKLNSKETKEQFTKRVINIINTKSVCRVVHQVDCEVKF